MTLYIFPEVNMKVEIEKNKISVYDNFTEKCVYQFEGVFIFKVLDNSNFMILEKYNKNDSTKQDVIKKVNITINYTFLNETQKYTIRKLKIKEM